MTKKQQRDIYQETTDRIIASLEAGTIPWQKPWHNIGGELPYSLSTGKPYRGVNVFLLAIESMTAGYTDPRWGTYKAITEAGGQVRKGEKGTRIILWKPVKKTEEVDGNEERRDYLLLRDYVVFNAEQADGLPELPKPELREHSTVDLCEEIIKGYCDSTRKFGKTIKAGPSFNVGGDRAFYSPITDAVRIPVLGQFDSADDYYATAFHELVHSTGHKDRTARTEWATFGSDPYAKEELVAEMGAAMLGGIAGLNPDLDENQAAYIANWLGKLKDDRKLVVQAAAQAQKAADIILGTTFEESAPADSTEAVAA